MKSAKYKFSRFNYYQKSDYTNSVLIYNSLKRIIIRIDPDEAQQMGIQEDGPAQVWHEYSFANGNLEAALIKYGIIVPSTYDENAEAHTRYLEEISSPVLRLTIVPTYRCNFRCPYCYQDHDGSGIMSQEVQDSIIRFIRKNITNYTAVEISWFGGEPLLCMDIILKINSAVKKICNERFKSFKSSITTNGYCLTKDNFEKLLEVGVRRYFITVDGLSQEHDKQRYLANGEGTFQTIINNLKDIRSIPSSRKFSINIRSNISKKNIDNLQKYLTYMSECFSDDHRFAFFFRRVYDWGGESIANFSDNLLEDDGDVLVIDELLKSERQMNYLEFYMDLAGSLVCYASQMNSYVINPDGSINKCTCADTGGNNAVGKLSLLGDLSLNKSLVGLWCSKYPENAQCTNCFFAGICLRSYCVSNNVMKNSRECNCFSAKNVCGKLLLLLDKCDESNGYIIDMKKNMRILPMENEVLQ